MGQDHSRTNITLFIQPTQFLRWGILIFLLIGLGSNVQARWENYFSEVAFMEENTVLPHALCSDSNGGQTFIAAVYPGTPGPFIYVKKYSRTGNPLWGEYGVAVPVDLASSPQVEPLVMVSDFDGGVYVAFRELIGTQHLVSLVRFDRDGHFAWHRPVGDFLTAQEEVKIHLAPDHSGSPGCLVAWSQKDEAIYPHHVMAAFVDKDYGIVQWQVDTGIQVNVNDYNPTEWDVVSDEQTGFLVTSPEIIQRVNHQGTLLWGLWGTTLQGVGGHLGGLVADGTGGAFVLTHYLNGGVTGQHLDSAGTNTWGSSGIILSPSQGYRCRVSFCTDQAGGFFFITGYEDLVGQRVDALGNKLWGANGITLTTLTQWQTDPNMVSDGFGGFLLAYKDHYFNESAISAMRVDAFGSILWQRDGAYWDTNNWDPVWGPEIVSDGWGGAAFAFRSQPSGESGVWVGIGSIGQDGAAPPEPNLTYCEHPYGVLDQVNQTDIHGQYLDLDNSFVFAGNGTEFPLESLVLGTNGEYLTGQVDLSGALPGPYDLINRYSTAEVARLDACYGIDLPPACDLESELVGESGSFYFSYGPRCSALVDDGTTLQTWLLQSQNFGTSHLMLWETSETESDLSEVYQTEDAISDLAFCAPVYDERFFVFVTDDGSDQQLVYLHNDLELTLPQPALQISECALALDGNGGAMIVFQAWDPGLNVFVLKSIVVDDGGFGQVEDLGAGYNALAPDLVATNNGFVVTYARDLWFPGAQEVCYQEYESGNWGMPISLNFAWSIPSVSVAWDGQDDLLFSYVLDNYTAEMVLFVSHVHGGTLDAARWVKRAPIISQGLVCGNGDDRFNLLSATGDGSGWQDIELHRCDNEVVYPPVSQGQVPWAFPASLASDGQGMVCSSWQKETMPNPMYRFVVNQCSRGQVSGSPVPEMATILAAHPNPFNPTTTLAFNLPRTEDLTLDVYDLQGRRLRRLHQGLLAAGPHEFTWDGRDDSSRRLASGVYFARLKGRQLEQTLKIALVK